MGIVLPGDTFKIAGTAELREKLTDVCGVIAIQMLTNKGEWVFDDVDGRKLIAFVVAKVRSETEICHAEIPPEFHSKQAWDLRNPRDHVTWPLHEWSAYSPTLVIPLLPATASVETIKEFMRSPRLANHPTLQVRRVYADFETSKKDKQYWHSEQAIGDWQVYKGESFDIWQPDTGRYYAYTDGTVIRDAAYAKWLRSALWHPVRRIAKSVAEGSRKPPDPLSAYCLPRCLQSDKYENLSGCTHPAECCHSSDGTVGSLVGPRSHKGPRSFLIGSNVEFADGLVVSPICGNARGPRGI